MTARGPWYLSASAVREYAALARLGDPADEDVFGRAARELGAIAEAAVASAREPRRLDSGLLQYRGPKPLRLRLLVSTVARREGPLPQLVQVLPAHEGLR